VKTTRRTTREETTRSESTFIETVETIGSGDPVQARGGELRGAAAVVGHDEKAARAGWSYLQEFFIEYPAGSGGADAPHVKVFANGLQQVPLRVILSPRNANGEFVAVPVDELRTMLNLVDYHTGAALPGGWWVRSSPNEYTYAEWAISNAPDKSSDDYVSHKSHPDDRARSGVLAPDQIAFDVYVATTNVVSLRIAASITPPGTWTPIETRPGASGSQFDSSVNIDGRPPLNCDISNFQMRQTNVANNAFKCINHYFTLVYSGQKIDLLRVEPYEAAQAYNVWVHTGELGGGWEGAFTICSTGNPAGGYEFHHYDVPTYLVRAGSSGAGQAPLHSIMAQIERFERGAILYVQHIFGDHMQFRWQIDAVAGNEVHLRNVYFVDEYGNRHRVSIGHPNDFLNFGLYSKW
jgi:hypothetical protein